MIKILSLTSPFSKVRHCCLCDDRLEGEDLLVTVVFFFSVALPCAVLSGFVEEVEEEEERLRLSLLLPLPATAAAVDAVAIGLVNDVSAPNPVLLSIFRQS